MSSHRSPGSVEDRAALQAARIVQSRLPRALAVVLATFLVVAVFEAYAYPDRIVPLLTHLPLAFALLLLGAYVASRPDTRPPRVLYITAATLVVFIGIITVYFIAVRSHGELLALGLMYLVVGAVVVFPWGVGPQTAVVLAAAGGYCLATVAGIPATTPRSIHFVGMISLAALTIASARALARQHLGLLRRDEEKDALLEIARQLAGNVQLAQALENVLARAADVLDGDIVALYRLDGANQVFRLTAVHGIPDEQLPAARAVTVPRDRTVFTRELARDRIVIVNDPSQFAVLDPTVLGQFGVRTLLVATLFLRDKDLGLLVAVRRRDLPFTEAQAGIFESIARQLSIAIEADEHIRQQEEEAEVGAALARVGRELMSALDTPVLLERLCRVGAEVLGADTCHAFLRDPQSGDYVVRAGFGDAPGRAETMQALRVPTEEVERHTGLFRDREVVLLGSPSPDPRRPPLPAEHGIAAAMAIALRRGPQLTGLLSAGRRDHHPFGPREQRIAGGIAQLASLALDNARLVEELDGAHRVKTDFVANMSHELRTPLNVIIGYNDLLAERAFGQLNPEQEDIVERVGRRSRELLELVNVTLDLSRIEAGDVPLAVRETNVANLLRDLEMETQLTRRKPKVELHWEASEGLPMVVTDAAKLRVILRNVVTNAIKFTDDGEIRVRADPSDGGVEIAVADTGIGIPADMLEAIFEPFRQVDGTPGRGHGVGLGLHLSRRLLAMLGGRIDVESEVGRGSTFRIWVPAGAPA